MKTSRKLRKFIQANNTSSRVNYININNGYGHLYFYENVIVCKTDNKTVLFLTWSEKRPSDASHVEN